MRAFVVSVFTLRSFYGMDEPSVSLSPVTLLRSTNRVEVLDKINAPFNSLRTRTVCIKILEKLQGSSG